MNNQTRAAWFGPGFGSPSPALTKIFKESLKEARKPRLEQLIKAIAVAILKEVDPDLDPKRDAKLLANVEELLRQFAIETEKAEDEDPKEIER